MLGESTTIGVSRRIADGAAAVTEAAAALERVRGLVAGWRLARLRVRGRAAAGIDVPFPGSLLRGALGAALHDAVLHDAALHDAACVRPGAPCGERPPRGESIYPAMFGPPAARDRGGAPRLFVLRPPERIAPGPVRFEIRLIAPDAGTLPAILEAVVEAGRAGLGRDRIPIAIDGIESLDARGERAAEVLGPDRRPQPGRVLEFPGSKLFEPPAGAEPRDLRVRLATPLRLREAGRIRSGLSFERLIRAALRRLISLGAALGQEWPRGWEPLLAAARAVEVVEDRTLWLDWGRYSRRQGAALRLGGIAGEIVYASAPPFFLPLLRAAEFFHLGKSCAFGLGAIDLEERP